MELLPLMADCANEERRLRSSGGKLRGWVSGSNLARREDDEEPGSVECRELRDGRDDDFGESMWDGRREDEVFLGDLDGDEGSERVWWESSRSSKCGGNVLEEDELVVECFLEDGFLLLLPPKNFIWGWWVGCARPLQKGSSGCPETRLCVILGQCPKRVSVTAGGHRAAVYP